MPKVPRTVLKEYFQSGDKPSAAQFGIFIDSTVNFVDDRDFIGLREYNPAVDYLPGDCAVFNDQVVRCITATTGPFNPAHWTVLAAFGSVTYMGTWDAQANNPVLQSSVGTQGFYYVVINASPDPNDNTTLNGTNDWITGDWAIFNGTIWERVDYSQAPFAAQNVSFVPTVDITSTNVQDAIEEVYTDLTTQLNDLTTDLSDKADKIIPTVTGNFAGLAADGNLIDSTKSEADFLASTTVANDIPFTPFAPISATDVQSAVEEVYNNLSVNKADKFVPMVTGNLAALDVDGNLSDSTKSVADFLPSTTEAVNIPFTPAGNISATDVQAAIEELDAEKQQTFSLTPNFYPYASGTNTLADGVISNESDGVALLLGKVLRSTTMFAGQIDFGALGNELRLTTDGSSASTSRLLLAPSDAKMYGDNVTVANHDAGARLFMDGSGIVMSNDGTTGADGKLEMNGIRSALSKGTYGSINITAGVDLTGRTTVFGGSSSSLLLTNSSVALSGPLAGISFADTGATQMFGATLTIDGTVKLNSLSASTVPVVDSSQNLVSSSVTPTQLGFVAGVTSAIQTQLNAKLPLTGGTLTGALILHADPSVPFGAATKQYVDGLVGTGEKKSVIAFTFDQVYTTTSGTNVRVPLAISLPPAGDVFTGTSTVTARLYVDYRTTDPTTNGRIGLNEWDATNGLIGGPIVEEGVPPTDGLWTKYMTAPFNLPSTQTVSIVMAIDVPGFQIEIEGATLILTYS